MDYTLLQHVVSAYKQLAPEGNVWVYTNAVSLIEYSNEELDFIKNNVNILLILAIRQKQTQKGGGNTCIKLLLKGFGNALLLVLQSVELVV